MTKERLSKGTDLSNRADNIETIINNIESGQDVKHFMFDETITETIIKALFKLKKKTEKEFSQV